MNDHYNPNEDYAEEFKEDWNKHRKWSRVGAIIAGIIMIVIGILCFIYPTDSFAAMLYVVAIVLAVVGVLQIVAFFMMPHVMRDPMMLLEAAFSILISIALFYSPLDLSVTTIAYMLAFLLIAAALEKLGGVWRIKFVNEDFKTTWITVSAILDLVLAVIFFIMPITGMSVIGYLLAAYLVVAGIAMLVEAISFKEA